MNKVQRLIIAINMFSLGLMIPVLNLILLDRGATLNSLALLFAVYSGTVLLFELPSGICADLFGRKAIFLISCIFSLVSFLLILFASNIEWLVFAMIMNGLGRAFSSGSLDALIIDQAIEKYGDVAISKVTSTMSILEGFGLSIGSICGGILASISGTYQLIILLRIVFTVMVAILCFFFIKEKKQDADSNPRERIHKLIKSRKIGQHNWKQLVPPRLLLILAGILSTGFLLNTIETYWQPAFKYMTSPQNTSWLLGIISFLGFLSVAIGNIIICKVLCRLQNHWWGIFAYSRLLFGVMIIVFALQNNVVGFILGYTGVYLFLGISNITESTIINKLIPGDLRASFLSLSSLLLQIGSLIASFISYLLIHRLHFSGLWLLAGTLVSGYAVFVITYLFINRNKPDLTKQKEEIINQREETSSEKV